MSYQQLTEGKRYQISVLLAEGFSFSQIAQKIDVHCSTISRELKRNDRRGSYLPELAQQCSQRRKASAAWMHLSVSEEQTFIRLVLPANIRHLFSFLSEKAARSLGFLRC